MKIGLATPTRGDRSIFLSRCLKMMDQQTLKADVHHIVSEAPKSDEKDITYRYKKAFNKLFSEGCDVVLLIEDDDFYSPIYIESMIKGWIEAGKPDAFGLDSTIYYHLTKNRYIEMKHSERSSAFSTLVTEAVLAIDFPEDSEPYLDMHIWEQLKGKTTKFNKQICMGIKHGVGIYGGNGHNERFNLPNDDSSEEFFKSVVGKEYNSYKNLIKQLK